METEVYSWLDFFEYCKIGTTSDDAHELLMMQGCRLLAEDGPDAAHLAGGRGGSELIRRRRRTGRKRRQTAADPSAGQGSTRRRGGTRGHSVQHGP